MNKRFLSTGKIVNSEKGALLLSVIVTIVIFAILGAAILSITSTSIFTQVYSNHATKAYYMAEAGFRYATMNIVTIGIDREDCLKCHASHGNETLRYSAGYGKLPDDTIRVHGKLYNDKKLLDGGSFKVYLAPFWFKFRAESGDWNKTDKKLTVHAVASSNLEVEVRCDFPEAFTDTDDTITGGLYIDDKYVKYTGIDAIGIGNGTLIFTSVNPGDISLPEDGVLIDVFPACLAKEQPALIEGGDLLINNTAGELFAFPNIKSVIKINNKLITYEHVDIDNGKLTGLGDVDGLYPVVAGLDVKADDIVILSKTLKITSTGRYPDADANTAVKTLEYYRWVGKPLTVPIVYNTAEPDEDKLLAGGNFYWVSMSAIGGGDDAKGHNIFQNNEDNNLNEAPGDIGFATCGASCHKNLSFGDFNDNGYSCNVCHFDPHPSVEEDWYRFVSYQHWPGDKTNGAKGIEHEKWNYDATSDSHNEYLGKEENGGCGFDGGLGDTTTAYCTGCHGEFHSDQQDGDEKAYPDNNLWIRHPSDWVIKNDGEFADAFGAGGSGIGTYYPDLPVARTSLAGGVSNEVKLGSDMVMCLSCHYAHGSPYDDSLRWDTNSRDSSINKCLTCHTQKTLDLHHSELTDCRSCHTMHDGLVGLLKP